MAWATKAAEGLRKAADGAALGKTSIRLPGSADREAHRSTGKLRSKLYRLQDYWRRHTEHERVSKCGLVRHSSAVTIQGTEERAAHATGLIKCRGKSCTVCLASRRAEYAATIEGIAATVAALHGGVYMATLTIRHGKMDTLAQTALGIKDAWRRFASGREWHAWRTKHAAEYILSEEMTYGANGWHPHLHVLFFTEKWLSEDEMLATDSWIFERWSNLVGSCMGEQFVPVAGVGTDFRPCNAATYISKTVGLELVDPGTKEGRNGGLTPVQILSKAQEGDASCLALYHEFERTMKGKRDLVFSAGLRPLRDALSLYIKRESAEEREQMDRVHIPPVVWRAVCRTELGLLALLEAFDRGGVDECCREIAARAGPGDGKLVMEFTRATDEKREYTKQVARETEQREKHAPLAMFVEDSIALTALA